ncbi:hypothetical protein BJ741DRAFT_602173 [Chytriomyces cf. hyalinus JEL632]|nr:hypothetical protein BJ741DRAFT_602173 [Chytriomyces cf. hyalinus JEL632]
MHRRTFCEVPVLVAAAVSSSAIFIRAFFIGITLRLHSHFLHHRPKPAATTRSQPKRHKKICKINQNTGDWRKGEEIIKKKCRKIRGKKKANPNQFTE